MPRNASGADFRMNQFLDVLHEFKSEVEERWSEYFDYQALRYHCPPAAMSLNVEDLCESLGTIYNLNIIVEPDVSRLNSIDLLFQARLNDASAGLPLDSSAITLERLKAIRENQDAARAKANASAATIPARLTRKTITLEDSALTYHVGGQGSSTIVILNALGHGLAYWHRLLDYLFERHRIVIPESQDVESLERILQHEQINHVHLLGWCTGPKVAVAFCRRCPAMVASLILLNSSFKCSERTGELDTPYERNLEQVCRSLVEQPAMEGVVRKTFLANTGEQDSDLLRQVKGEELATAVLSRTNEALKQHILEPFHSDATTLDYARQLLDFLAYDAVGDAQDVLAPVLLVGAEHDSVAAPETTNFMARYFPNAQAVNIPGATHYCIYDRPRFIVDLIEKFLADFEMTGDSLATLISNNKKHHGFDQTPLTTA